MLYVLTNPRHGDTRLLDYLSRRTASSVICFPRHLSKWRPSVFRATPDLDLWGSCNSETRRRAGVVSFRNLLVVARFLSLTGCSP